MRARSAARPGGGSPAQARGHAACLARLPRAVRGGGPPAWRPPPDRALPPEPAARAVRAAPGGAGRTAGAVPRATSGGAPPSLTDAGGLGPLSRLGARDGPSRHPSREHAGAEEGALEGALAVQPSPTEASRLADRVEAGDRLPVGPQHPAAEIGLDPAQALARHRLQPDCQERHGSLVDDPLELRGSEAVAPPVPKLGDPPELV